LFRTVFSVWHNYFFFLIFNDTRAAGVFLTNCLPFAPAAFFFLAVAARCEVDNDLALDIGRQRSGFFLFLDVPHLPAILPELLIRTQFCALHFANSPISYFFFFIASFFLFLPYVGLLQYLDAAILAYADGYLSNVRLAHAIPFGHILAMLSLY